MCYHKSLSPKKFQALEERFNAEFVEPDLFSDVHHISGFAFPRWPVVAADDPEKIQFYKWGLIPSWVKNEQQAVEMRSRTLNARSETILEKPSFRRAVQKGRCLIPFSGFFEWRTLGKQKFPYYISLREQEIGSFAGVSEAWTNQATGEIIYTYSVVTTAANPLMEQIHNTKKRMPLILPMDREKDWIDPSLSGAEALKLAEPIEEELMTAHPISKLITSRTVDSNVPEVKRPHSYPELEKTLFD